MKAENALSMFGGPVGFFGTVHQQPLGVLRRSAQRDGEVCSLNSATSIGAGSGQTNGRLPKKPCLMKDSVG